MDEPPARVAEENDLAGDHLEVVKRLEAPIDSLRTKSKEWPVR